MKHFTLTILLMIRQWFQVDLRLLYDTNRKSHDASQRQLSACCCDDSKCQNVALDNYRLGTRYGNTTVTHSAAFWVLFSLFGFISALQYCIGWYWHWRADVKDTSLSLESVSGWRKHFRSNECFPFSPSVLWRCWLSGRKGIRPVKTEWWGAGMVICLELGADLHTAQLMPLPLTVSLQ